MLSLRSAFPFVLLALGATTPGSAEFVLFKNTWGDVLVATDTTPAGRALTPPTREQPVYYRGKSLGPKLGSIPGDREPDIKQLNQFVADVLAKQGYLPAGRDTPDPALFLVLQWGYTSADLPWFLGYNAAQDIAATAMPGEPGPEVVLRNMRSRLIDTIMEDAQGPIYGIIVTAFEFKSASTPAPIAYWQTRIGLPATGKSMAEALPVMITAAGSAIGRVADKPLMLDADRARQGQVKFGELKFLDYYDKSAPPPAESDDGKK
jgi:hypothetical protein